ncbi:hypothetical protein L1285_00100 [Pseudoalteromonas sp. DL2-H2.2]|uniref:WD40 repeat domain-containing protein n=1 Tax=Pseudoalteromonas sp. DL2-H2.2 TaxID=2908889 RepID=UPI001F45601B|nr:hypothetical protein [Pseudoalteromonas sp. DL2-H2.2]MCF2906739.1 hypothetical protein [Pseudoalteromonas sp. DL2-H2.2]
MAQFATHLLVSLGLLTVFSLSGCDTAHEKNDTQLINLGHSAVAGQFSADGRYVVLHNPGDKLAVFDVATADLIFTKADPITQSRNTKGKILAFSLSEDNRQLAIGYRTSVEVWDIEQGKQLGTVSVHPTSELAKISTLRLYNRPYLLLVGLNDGTINLLDLNNQLVKKAKAHDSTVMHIAMSAQGQNVISAAHDGQILLYDAHTLTTKRRFTFDRRITSVAQSPDEASMFASDALNEQRIFSVYSDADYDVTLRYPERFRWFRAAAFSADQRYLATGSSKAWWTLWDAQNGQEIGAFYIKALSRDATIMDMYTDSQGQLLTLSSDGFIEFWQISTLLNQQ